MFDFFRRRKALKLLTRAEEVVRGGDPAGAKLLLEQVMALDLEQESGLAAVMLAALARERGDLAEACRHLEQARARLPDEGGPAVELGDDFRNLGKHAEAVRAYDAARSCAKLGPKQERRAVRGAALAAFAGGAPDAQERLESAVDGFALDSEVWSTLARLHTAAGRRAEARAALLQILRGEREDVEAHERLLALTDEARARSLAELWRPEPVAAAHREASLASLFDDQRMKWAPEAAVTAITREAEAGPLPKPRALAALVLLRGGRVAQARAILAAAVEHPFIRFTNALLAIHEEREEDARALLEGLHAEGLPFPGVAFLLGVRCEVLEDPAAAEPLYREVLDADPDDAEASLQLAAVLRQREQLAQARAIERRAYLVSPVLLSPKGRYRQDVIAGRRLRARRRRLEARLAEAPGDQESLRELVRACTDMGDYRAALNSATRLGDVATPARAYAYFGAGDLGAACADYRACLRQSPDDLEVRTLLGQVLAMTSQEVEAERLLDEVIRRDPEVFEARATKGILLSKRGERAEAEIHYRAAMRSNPTSADPHLNLGIDLVQRGKLAEAERAFRFARLLAPDDAQAHQRHAATLQQLGRRDEAALLGARTRALVERDLARRALGGHSPFPAPESPSPWTREVRAGLAELAGEVCGD